MLTILLMLCYDDYRLLIGNFITVRFDDCKNCYVCAAEAIFWRGWDYEISGAKAIVARYGSGGFPRFFTSRAEK